MAPYLAASETAPRRPRVRRAAIAALVWLFPVAAPVATAQPADVAGLKAAALRERRNPQAQRAYGLALLRAGKPDEAERQLRQAALLQPGSLEAAYDLARVAFAREDLRKARAACHTLKEQAAEAALTQICLARAFLTVNRSGRAFEHLEQALAQAPDHPEAWLALGDAHRLRAAVEESESAYRKAATLAPDAPEAWLGLGRLYIASDRREEARSALEQTAAKQADQPEVLLELGRLSEGEEAIRWLERAVASRPAWGEAQLALGEAKLRNGDRGGAEQAFERAAAANPHLADAHRGLGQCRQAAGDHPGAEKAFRKALALVPNAASAALGLADALGAQQRHQDAFDQYMAAAHLQPSDPEPYVRAAALALTQGRGVVAAGYLDRALQRNPRYARAHALLGDILVDRGARQEAIAHYRKALAGEGPVEKEAVRARLAQAEAIKSR
jgi:tetratricopeptide (TPR) repeat protein